MIYVGIDISKKTLDVFHTYDDQIKSKTLSNTTAGIKALIKYLPIEAFVIFESTGAYTKLLYKALCDEGIHVCCANPLTVRRFAQGMGYVAKNDKIDAKVLALYGEKAHPQRTQFRNDTDLELNELIYVRDALLHEIQALQNRLELPFVCFDAEQVLRNSITALQEQLAHIQQMIEAFMNRHKEYAEKVACLITIPGIGYTTAYNLLAYCPELGSLSKRQHYPNL